MLNIYNNVVLYYIGIYLLSGKAILTFSIGHIGRALISKVEMKG